MSLQLCLLNNDPTSTLLIDSTGQPLYSIKTPHFSTDTTDAADATGTTLDAAQSQSECSLQCPCRSYSKTTVTRLDDSYSSTGHVETTVGIIEGNRDDGATLQLCVTGDRLSILPPPTRKPVEDSSSMSDSEEAEEEEEDSGDMTIHENSWEFIGPDDRRYKWEMFVHSPVLILVDTSLIPLARYRRAKVGIVSRPRRPFLEILPAGFGIMDLVVVTFVAFVKHRVLQVPDDDRQAPSPQSTSLAVSDTIIQTTPPLDEAPLSQDTPLSSLAK